MIRRIATDDEAHACAAFMAASEPWITLGRGYDACLRALTHPEREIYVDDQLRGFIILNMNGPFVGYIQTICVDAAARSSGLGTQLMAFAEERIFRDHDNVFLCVSSFNTRARALYERRGYVLIGEIPDYLIRGASELFMRKTRGPIYPR